MVAMAALPVSKVPAGLVPLRFRATASLEVPAPAMRKMAGLADVPLRLRLVMPVKFFARSSAPASTWMLPPPTLPAV